MDHSCISNMIHVSKIRNGGKGQVVDLEQKRCAAVTKTSAHDDDNKKELLDAQEDIRRLLVQKQALIDRSDILETMLNNERRSNIANKELHNKLLVSAKEQVASEKDLIICGLKDEISSIKRLYDEVASSVHEFDFENKIVVAMGKKHQEEKRELITQCVELDSKVKKIVREKEKMNKAHNKVIKEMDKKYEADKAQLTNELKELRNELFRVKSSEANILSELSSVKKTNTEVISKIQQLESDKESARIRSDAIVSAMEKTHEKDREQQERMVQELSNELSKVKESNTELILNLKNLKLDKESARISSDAIMSVMEETYEKDREQQERKVQELSNELSKVKESNTELISKIQDLEFDKESARMSSNVMISVIEETYEKDREQQERMSQELRNELASVKKSSTELIKQIQDLELDNECARISFDAVISALEENYEIDQEQYRKEVQNLQDIVKEKEELDKKQMMKLDALETELERMKNESAASKANDNAEIGTLKNELQRVNSNCSQLCNELVEEKRNRLANIIALTSDINEMKKKNSALQEEKELSNEELRNIKRELQNEKANKSQAEELVALLNNKVSQQEEEINELTVRLQRKRGLRGLISCCF